MLMFQYATNLGNSRILRTEKNSRSKIIIRRFTISKCKSIAYENRENSHERIVEKITTLGEENY